MSKASIKKLNEWLRYDAISGKFYWLKSPNHFIKSGSEAGHAHAAEGYIHITVFRQKYLAHHLAWAFTHNEWPLQLDHRDLNKTNNRIENLREATTSQNNMNRALRRSNKSGYTGVFHTASNKYEAYISLDGKRKCLGRYQTIEEAVEVRQLWEDICFGSFTCREIL